MFEDLKAEIRRCRYCAERFGFEPHPVVWGNGNAKIMQISQAPSQKVHQSLKPFDDASGKKLRNEWYRISDEDFYNPGHFYITATAHCYPGKNPHGGDRLPPKVCAPKWLHREVALAENEIFILIGAKAAEVFFPKRDFSALVFEDQSIGGKPAYVLPHPSPLNVKWFKDHPEFENSRIQKVAKAVHRVLGLA